MEIRGVNEGIPKAKGKNQFRRNSQKTEYPDEGVA